MVLSAPSEQIPGPPAHPADQSRLVAALHAQARTDALTGLPNRLAFEERLADVLAPPLTGPVSLAMLDMSTPVFIKGLRLFFDPYDVQFALIKALSFGLVVTGVGSFYGFHTTGGAEGVGHAKIGRAHV